MILRSAIFAAILFVGQAAFSQTCDEANNNVMQAAAEACTQMRCPDSYWGCEGMQLGPSTGSSRPIQFRLVRCSDDFHTIGGYSDIADCMPPDIGKPTGGPGNSPLEPSRQCGSVVTIEDQALGEHIPLVGVGFDLMYSSNYVIGKSKYYNASIPITGSSLEGAISSFDLVVSPDGLTSTTAHYLNSTTNQSAPISWDGKDASGNEIQGYKKYAIEITAAFSQYSFPRHQQIYLGGYRTKFLGLGGWAPSVLFYYDKGPKRLMDMSGHIRNIEAKPFATGQVYIASEDGNYVYIFDDTTGLHLYTKTGLTGTTIYTFAYDGSGRLTSITEPFSKVTTFNRDVSGKLLSITAPYGQITTVTIAASGYLESVTNPNSETYQLTYYTGGLLNTYQKPAGHTNTFTYDGDGNLTQDSHSGGYVFQLIKNASADIDIDVRTGMSRNKNVHSVVTANSISTTTTMPDGIQSQYSQTKFSTPGYGGISSTFAGLTRSQSTTPDPRFPDFASYVNDSQQNIYIYQQNIDSSRSVILTNPSDPFSVSSMTDTSTVRSTSTTQTTVYDGATKKFTTTTGEGRTSERTIDNYERTVATKLGNLETTYFNYTNDQLTSIVQGTRTTQLTYSPSGLLNTVQNPAGTTAIYTYDSSGRLSQYQPTGGVLQNTYSYDANGNMTTLAISPSVSHAFTFNAQELLSTYAPPTLSGVPVVNTTYTYNADKQITNIARPDGKNISFTYHPTSARQDNYTTDEGTFTQWFSSASGFLETIIRPDTSSLRLYYMGLIANEYRQYNTFNQKIAIYRAHLSEDAHMRVDYDNVEGRSSDISTVYYQYDNDDKLTQAADLVLSYNTPNGQLTGTSIGSVTDSYTYNTYGEITGYQAKYGSTVIYDFSATRDALGRITAKTQTMNSVTDNFTYAYSYWQLSDVTKNGTAVSQYGHDVNGNRNSGFIGAQTTSATYDAQDRLLTYNTLSFNYNANGDLTSRTNSTTSTTTSYVYDVFGNLRQATLPSGNIIDFNVDPLNRRFERRVNGNLTNAYVYAVQNRIVGELDSSGAIYKRYVYGTKQNTPDLMIMGGESYRIISDYLGSPRLVVKVSDGSIVERMNHDEFGRVTEDTNPGFIPFGFAGGLYDVDLGIVRFGARDYDPEIGRWTAKDPIRFNGGDTNLYGYVMNDPVNWIDPSGLEGLCIDHCSSPINTMPGAGAGIGAIGASMCGPPSAEDNSKPSKSPSCNDQYAIKNAICSSMPSGDAKNKCYADAWRWRQTCKD